MPGKPWACPTCHHGDPVSPTPKVPSSLLSGAYLRGLQASYMFVSHAIGYGIDMSSVRCLLPRPAELTWQTTPKGTPHTNGHGIIPLTAMRRFLALDCGLNWVRLKKPAATSDISLCRMQHDTPVLS